MLADQEECLSAGMNAHLAKPIRMELLYERMVQCLPSYLSSASFCDPEGMCCYRSPRDPGIPWH